MMRVQKTIGLLLFTRLFCAYPLQPQGAAPRQLDANRSRQTERIIQRAEKAENNGDWDEALKSYKEALALRPRSTILAAKIGALYYNRHDYEQALTHLEKALMKNPLNFEAAKFAGIAAYRLNKFAAAAPFLEKAAALRANDPEVHYWLGAAYYARGNSRKAVDELRQSLQRNPKDIETLYLLGKIQGALSQQAWEEMRAIDPDSYRVHQLMAEYFTEKSNFPEAVEQYKAIIKKVPDFPGFRASLGDLYLRMGRDSEAEGEFQDELKIDPHSFISLYGLAKVCIRQQRYSSAAEYATQAIQEKPDFGEAYITLGTAYARLGESQKAVEAFQRAARLLPADPSPHYMLMQIYVASRRLELVEEEKRIFERLSSQWRPSEQPNP